MLCLAQSSFGCDPILPFEQLDEVGHIFKTKMVSEVLHLWGFRLQQKICDLQSFFGDPVLGWYPE